jgi:hypothetical protein
MVEKLNSKIFVKKEFFQFLFSCAVGTGSLKKIRVTKSTGKK